MLTTLRHRTYSGYIWCPTRDILRNSNKKGKNMDESEFKNITLEELEAIYTKEEVGDYVLEQLATSLGITKKKAFEDFAILKEKIRIV